MATFRLEMIASTQTNHPLITIDDPAHRANSLELSFDRLRAAGLRITRPRIKILRALLQRDQPSSIEQIHGDLARGSCDLVTVYRCLSAFEEIGLVRRSFFYNGTSLYDLQLNEVNRYHVIGKGTNQVTPLDAESTEELRATIQRIEERLQSQGYSKIGHVVEFFATEPAPSRAQSQVVAP